MSPKVGISPIKKEIALKAKYVMDIIFNPRRTQLLLDSNSYMDGLYMLVSQAVKSEEIWQDKKFPSDVEKILKEVEVKI